MFVDPARLHPTYGRTRYIGNIISTAADRNARSTLSLGYRQLRRKFNDENGVQEINKRLNAGNELTPKSLKIVADIASNGGIESNLGLSVDDVAFNHIGKGEQNKIQIKIAIQNKSKDVHLVMLEEPENLLSHVNLMELVTYIESKNAGKQIFLTTHSSYVLNKLSIDKLCLLSGACIKLKNIGENTVRTLKRLPGYDTLRLVLANRVVLVEGPSDELVLKKLYLTKHGKLPENDGIDIIVVRGIGFKVYLDIARALRHPIRIVKDNDGDYESHIVEWRNRDYKECEYITCHSPDDNAQYSLEPALVAANSDTEDRLDTFAKVILSPQTFAKYSECAGLPEKSHFIKTWFKEDSGGRKVDSAIRIFDSKVSIEFPEYLKEALRFDA